MLELARTATPDRVSRHATGVPTELEAIIAQLLEKDPEKRPPNPLLLCRRLEAMLHALSLSPKTCVGGFDTGRESESSFDLRPPAQDSDRSQIDGLTVTSVAGDSDVQEGPSTDVHSLSVHAGGVQEELLETRATSAFQAYDPPARPAAPKSEPQREPQRKPGDRFVVVAEEELDRHEAEEHPHAALISLQTWILAISLVAIGLTAWYLLQPPSADHLYEKIRVQTADRSIDSLRAAENDIKEFLTRFSGDPRSATLRKYVQELELHRLEQAFERRSRGIGSPESLLPIENAYQEAINYARIDPERGMVKLQALLDLYNHRADISGPTGQCLELARRRLEQLEELVRRSTADHLAMVEDRLDRAERLRQTDPQRARAMWQAVVELYAEKPWAADAVRRARESLAESAESEPRTPEP
jgi:hypothetical protein